jgi:hypothetical protein
VSFEATLQGWIGPQNFIAKYRNACKNSEKPNQKQLRELIRPNLLLLQ